MINFTQFLSEARMAPLYHATRYAYAKDILEQNTIRPSERRGRYNSKSLNQAISLTRSLKTAKDWISRGIIFELDQQKLAQNYKIKPVNMAHVWSQTPELKMGDVAKNKGAKYEELFEEFVTKPIHPLSKYLTKIIVNGSDDDFNYYAPNILKKHPLLWYNGKFVNK